MRFLIFSTLILAGCALEPKHHEESDYDKGVLYYPSAEEQSSLDSSVNPWLIHAMEIKQEADLANERDIHRLLQGFALEPVVEPIGFAGKLQQRLQQDLQIAKALHSAIYDYPEHIGNPPLRTSLGKLISSGLDDHGNPLTGLLQDALAFYDDYGWYLHKGIYPPINVSNNSTTVLKLLLFYMHQVREPADLGSGADLSKVQQLQLIYPDTFPEEIDAGLYQGLSLYSGKSGEVYFPNAGYVFGGNYIGDENKGIDCSEYLSKVTNSTVRMSTKYMAVAWQAAADRYNEIDPQLLREFIADGLESTLEEFEAIEPGGISDLRVGDLVIWRELKGGHVTMYTGLTSDNHLIGIEATRSDDKSKEGLHYIAHELHPPDTKTYVLRRRTDS